MGEIKPLEKNKRICNNCNATYCINGDPSDYWCQLTEVDKNGNKYQIGELCEFCRPNGKYSLNKE